MRHFLFAFHFLMIFSGYAISFLFGFSKLAQDYREGSLIFWRDKGYLILLLVTFFMLFVILLGMRALIIYYTMGGRTKRMAEAIASSLNDWEVSYLSIEMKGGFFERLGHLDKLQKNDFSEFEPELQSLDIAPMDVIFIGMPTYGRSPPNIFIEILRSPLNIFIEILRSPPNIFYLMKSCDHFRGTESITK